MRNKRLLNSKKLVEDYLYEKDWRVKENSNSPRSFGALNKYIAGEVSKNYWLNEVYPKKVKKAYLNNDMHIHDLGGLTLYCCGYSLENILKMGVQGVPNIPTSAPAKHFSAILNQIANLITVYQNEAMGAIALNSVDTLLSPFIKNDNLTRKQVKQELQNFIYSINSNSRGGCVPETTELLTPTGFKKYNDLKVGDSVYTWKNGALNINTINKMNIFDFSGDLISFEGRDYCQTVTPNHRVLRQQFNKHEYSIAFAKDLVDINSPMSFPVSTHENNIGGVEISNELIELLAFVLTEGCFDEKRIRIYKSPNRWGNTRLLEIFNTLDINYSVTNYKSTVNCDEQQREYDMNRYTILAANRNIVLNIMDNKKEIPNVLLNMNKEQSKLFIDTWVKLDGSVDRLTLQCDNTSIADAIQHIAFLAGYGSRQYTRVMSESNRVLYVQLYIRKNKGNSSINHVPYKGKVWCPTTDDGIVVFRENGKIFISGNSEPAFSNITLDVTPSIDMLSKQVILGGEKQDSIYGDFQKEMDLFNDVFTELMLEGDVKGEPFAYPIITYNIGKRFDWDNPKNDNIFEMAGKFGYPYFANFVNSDMDESDCKSMCCRLRLDIRELKRRNGGLFGSGDNTGSIGVVTINLPKIGYLTKNKKDLFKRLDKVLILAKDSLEIKRKFLENEILNGGLLPAYMTYVGTISNHFSTIGEIGKNEMCENFLGKDILSEEGRELSLEVGEFIRIRLADFQEETENLYNYEATPAESTSFRLASNDKKKYPKIITRGTGNAVYYTNSCHIPVYKVESIKQVYDHQDALQQQYTGGTVIHNYLNGAISGTQAKHIIKTILTKYKAPYTSLSPLNRYCSEHGYVSEQVDVCPICGKPLDFYQRITGYLRPVENFNVGKKQEFLERKQLDGEKESL